MSLSHVSFISYRTINKTGRQWPTSPCRRPAASRYPVLSWPYPAAAAPLLLLVLLLVGMVHRLLLGSPDFDLFLCALPCALCIAIFYFLYLLLFCSSTLGLVNWKYFLMRKMHDKRCRQRRWRIEIPAGWFTGCLGSPLWLPNCLALQWAKRVAGEQGRHVLCQVCLARRCIDLLYAWTWWSVGQSGKYFTWGCK